MSAAPHPATRTVQSLAVLLDLTRRARAAGSVRELAFLAVNDSSQLAPLRQGATWRLDMGVIAKLRPGFRWPTPFPCPSGPTSSCT